LFHAYSASLNASLTEALRLRGGRSFQIFVVGILAQLVLVSLFSFSSQCVLFRSLPLHSRCRSQELQGQVGEKFNHLAELSQDLD
jgi:hypothetical protein